MSKEVIVFDLCLSGIFGRNRKEKFEVFKLAESETDMPAQMLAELVESKLRDIKLKQGKWSVTKNKETLEVMDGVTFRTRTLRFGQSNTILAGGL
jgi:hypothetical protein